MENTNRKIKKPKNKTITFMVLVLGMMFCLVIVGQLVATNTVAYYINDSLTVKDILKSDLSGISEELTYKDILKKLGETKDIGQEEHIALYRVDNGNYLYITFTKLNEVANLSTGILEEKIVAPNMNDRQRLYLEARAYNSNGGLSKTLKIIEDVNTLNQVLNIFGEGKEGTTIKTTSNPTYLVKGTFTVEGVGILYLDEYDLWLNSGLKAVIRKAGTKYEINELDTKLLKKIFLGEES